MVVRARDAVWAMDATHLGRDAHGGAVQAEVVREAACARTIGLWVGPPASGQEVVRILEDDSQFNAGRGAVFNHERRNELDA